MTNEQETIRLELRGNIMQIRYYMAASIAAMSVASFSTAVSAQSTGSIEVEEEEAIVVTGTRASDGVGGVVSPDATKPRAVLTQELIARQGAGQSILNTINQIPGVNFTNSDAYGSSGGNLRIRGFDGNRISLTFDGFPLNDTGNYAIFSNQQLDPELINSVNVNLGTTDVDSPTASAAGGTVNYLTRIPGDEVGATLSASYGEDNYHRIFGMIDSGVLTSFGTKLFVSASTARNDKFKGPGEIYKQQYNARIYQPIGDNGDFISLAGHYNQNRNNFYRNPTLADLRLLTGRSTMVDVGGFTRAQEDAIFGFENFATCTRTVGGAGAQNDGGGRLPTGNSATANTAPAVLGSTQNNIDNTSSCTNFAGLRINPSNTGNARFNSKFSITDNLKFTFDASYQYVLANGGGTTVQGEGSALVRGSSALLGVDYNGDGDLLDSIRFYTPNTTNTRRWTVISSLIWDITDQHRVRLAYTFDRGRHRQTGEWGYLDAGGNPENVFGGRNGRPVLSADGVPLRQRDRLSIALLNQISGQYVGKFFDDKLRVEFGVRLPFFKRDLNQFCFTQAGGSGFATCTSQTLGTTPGVGVTYVVPNNFVLTPTTLGTPVFAPFVQTYKFSPILPSVGFNYKITDDLSLFGSYAKGFSAPRTDNLYRAPIVNVDPETTNTFDAGLRYTTSRVQAQAGVWYTNFKNRIVTSFDQTLGISVDRNIGSVKGKGVDIGIAVRPLDWFTFQGNLSYNDSKLQDNIQVAAGATGLLLTAGKRVTETPKWTAGYRAQVEFGPVEIGLQVKYVSDRFATDFNDVVSPSYTTADLDARFSFEQWGLKKTWFQLNVSNLFDRFYFGNIGTQISAPPNPGGAQPNFALGAPRTVSGTFRVGF
jgi:iron complex outermembrane recepter protein